MARRGENIYKRKDGRWEGRYIYTYDSNGKAKYRSVYAQSYSKVKELLLLYKQPSSEFSINSSRKTLKFYSDIWLNSVKLKNKESTYCKYKGICENHILPVLGKYQISKISTSLVEKFLLDKLHMEQLSATTVKLYLCILKMIFSYANQDSCQTICCFSALHIHQSSKNMRILNLEEQKKLTNYLKNDMSYIKMGIYLCLCTGIRIGELCALKWKNVSFENKILHINKTMQRISSDDDTEKKTKIIVTPPKTIHSEREIPLTDSVTALLEKYHCKDETYILTGKSDTFVEPHLLQYHFKKCIKDCGIKNTNFHALRHTFATRCVEAGFEIKTLSEILGHSSVNITLNRYVHSSMEWKRSNMEKLEEFI